jgi:hypothetical protein
LRNLKKCEACGFPVSAGRVLCVECEEKKWRGQLRTPRPVAAQKAAVPAPAPEPISAPVARLMAAAAATAAETAPERPSAAADVAAPVPVPTMESKEAAAVALTPTAVEPVPATSVVETTVPDFVLSAGLEPSQSWLSRNKYVVGAIVLVAATVVAILVLR